MPRRVALASCAAFPELDADNRLLLPELAARGVAAEPAVWNDTSVRWDAFDLVVIRATWDYSQQRDLFLEWASTLPRCCNAPAVLRWNTDKHYLAELASQGVPIVPTEFLAPGEELQEQAMEFVIKPTVSAGARQTARYTPAEVARARAHVRDIHDAGGSVMLQPYQARVDREGETALIYLRDTFSHAVRKAALLARGEAPSTALFAWEMMEPRQASQREREAAERVLSHLPMDRRELLYARVDLITDEQGDPRLLELELAEPSLFLGFFEAAAGRLADGIVQTLG